MKTFLFLGDSLTAGYGAAPSDGWVSGLSMLHKDIHFINEAVCGISMDDIACRCLLHLRDPSVESGIFLMGGTNDILMGIRLSHLQDLTESVILEAQKKAVHLYLGIPPLTTNASITEGWQAGWQYEGTNGSLREYASFLRSAARSNHVPVMDFQTAFERVQGQFYADGVHPNRDGYGIFCRTAENVLRFYPL